MSLETLENQNDVDCSAREILQFRHAWVWQTRKCESRRRESHLPLPSYITPSLSLSLSPPEHHSTWKTSNASIMPLSEFKPNRGRKSEKDARSLADCSLLACMPMSCREYQAGKAGLLSSAWPPACPMPNAHRHTPHTLQHEC